MIFTGLLAASTSVVVGMCMVLGMALSSEARDWGFSKDTVFEGSARGDTVWLVNHGTDMVVLDSLYAESDTSSRWVDIALRHAAKSHPSQNAYYHFQFVPETPRLAIKMIEDSLLQNDSTLFWGFDVSANCITKRAATPSTGPDTLVVRLRVKSLMKEEDTLIVKGRYCVPNSLIPSYPGLELDGSPVFLNRDLRGRRVEPSGNIPALRH